MKKESSFYALIAGSIVSAILASSCCLAPLLFLIFGVSVGSLSFLQIFAPYHTYFSIFSIVVVAYLWINYFFKIRKQISCSAKVCKNYRLYLSEGTFFVLLLTTYPYWVTYLLD